MAGRSTGAARTRWLLAGLLLASSAVKIAFLLPNADMTPRADELQYLFFARAIADGEGLPGSLRPPVHPYLLGLAVAVTPAGASPRIAAGLLLILVSCVTLVLLYRLAADLFDRRAGLLAAGIAGFYPDFIAGTHLLWSEGVALCPTAAALLALVRARRGASARLALLAGALLGVSALTREFVLWFAPLAALWIARAGGWSRPRARLALLVLAGTVLCVLPWTVRNAFLHRAFVPISTNTATPLFLDNNDVLPHAGPDYLVRFYAEWGERELERERYALRHALDFIRKRPIRWAWWRLRIGVPALLRIDSLSLRHLQHGWYGEVSPRVRRGVVIATAGSYLALLVTGAFGLSAFRSSADRWLLILFLAYGALVVMPYPIEARYRSPLELVVIPFAAAWLAGAEGTVRLREHPLRLALACAAAILALAMAWTLPPAI